MVQGIISAVVWALVVVTPSRADAQEPSRQIVVESLLAFREALNHDTTKFDSCSVDDFIGTVNARSAMPPRAQRLIDTRQSCAVGQPCIVERPRVLLDSLVASGSLYTVYSITLGSNAIYRESSTGRWSGRGYVQFFESRRWGYTPRAPSVAGVLSIPQTPKTSRC